MATCEDHEHTQTVRFLYGGGGFSETDLARLKDGCQGKWTRVGPQVAIARPPPDSGPMAGACDMRRGRSVQAERRPKPGARDQDAVRDARGESSSTAAPERA